MADYDKTCSGHGSYNGTSQTCICDAGSHRVGPQCESCEENYELNIFSECVKSGICYNESCGCLNPKGSKQCDSPIGICKLPSTGEKQISCKCPRNYAGSRCEKCAPGFKNYPACESVCAVPCVHGTCPDSTRQCVCDGNWDGPSCSQCLPGHSGDNCEMTMVGLKLFVAFLLGVVCIVGLGVAYVRWKKRQAENITDSPGDFELGLEGGRRLAGINDGDVKSDTDSDEEKKTKTPDTLKPNPYPEFLDGSDDSDENLLAGYTEIIPKPTAPKNKNLDHSDGSDEGYNLLG